MTISIHDKIDYSDEFCIENKPDSCGLVIFGASGDLTYRKLIPAIYDLYKRTLLPDGFFILGYSRSKMDDHSFRERLNKAINDKFEAEKEIANSFLKKCFYLNANYDSEEDYSKLETKLRDLNQTYQTKDNIIFYLATPPTVSCNIVRHLADSKLTKETTNGWKRVVIEKPFGTDLKSAMDLNARLHKFLEEEQIYRIDHYLGKETVQNILMFRFANMVFKPVWNREYIDHIQITVAEELGIGSRAGYFEEAGLLRDVFQNHMMQLLTLIAMEEPSSMSNETIRDERVKLLKAIEPLPHSDITNWIIRGQYSEGNINGNHVVGYKDEEGVDKNSKTETFVAAKIFINNKRWKKVPFYLRAGKRLPTKSTEIVVTFKPSDCCLFKDLPSVSMSPNRLIFNVQPNEGIGLTIQAKHPGPKLCISTLTMDFSYNELFGDSTPEPYSRLLLDAMVGDQTLFIRQDGMKYAWKFLTPILETWEKNSNFCPLYQYPAGTWGPKKSDDLIKKDGRKWFIANPKE